MDLSYRKTGLQHALVLILLVLAYIPKAQAQTDTARATTPNKRSLLSIGWHYGKPLGSFASTRNKPLWGMNVQGSFQLGHLPIDAGLAFNLDWLQRSTFDVRLARANAPDTTARAEVKHQSYALLPMVRLSPLRGAFQCYAELFGGTRMFLNTTKVSAELPIGPRERTRYLIDFTAEWGLAAGVMVRVNPGAFLEFRFAYNRGGKALFLDRESSTLDAQGRLDCNTIASATQAWRATIAVGRLGGHN
jgi:hypothetical protein